MPNAGSIRAGAAFILLTIVDKTAAGLSKALAGLRAFTKVINIAGAASKAIGKSLNEIGSGFTAFGAKLLTAGAAVAAPLALTAKLFDSVGSAINDAAQRTGLTAEAFQTLAFAAEQSGASMEAFEGGIKFMQKALTNAALGSREASRTLGLLGLTVKDLTALKPEDQFALIGDRLSQIKDPAIRAGLAMQVFGRSGTELLPMLANGASGLQAFAAEARAAGIIMSNEDVAAADKFGDAMGLLWKQVRAVAVQIGAAVAKAMTPFITKAQAAAAVAIQWVRANEGIIASVATIAATFAAVSVTTGAASLALGGSLKVIGVAFTAAGIALTAAGAAMGALLTPFGLVTTAVIAGGAAFIDYRAAASDAVAFLARKFAELQRIAGEMAKGIADALAAGDIQAAAAVLWAGLKVAWLTGIKPLRDAWNEFTADFLKQGIEAFYGLLNAWEKVSASLQTAVANTASGIGHIWQNLIFDLTKEFDFLEKRQRDLDKARIKKRLEDPNLAPNARALLERQLATTDQQAEQALAARNAKDREEALQRQITLKERLAKIDADQAAALKANADAEDALKRAVDANAKADIDAATKDLKQASDNLDAATKRAAQARLDARVDSALASFFDDVASSTGKGGDGGPDLANIGRASSSTQFGGQGLDQLFGGSLTAAQQTAKNTARTADLLSTIAADKSLNDATRQRERGAGAGLPDFTPTPHAPIPQTDKQFNDAARERERPGSFFGAGVTGLASRLAAAAQGAQSINPFAGGGSVGLAGQRGSHQFDPSALATLLKQNNTTQQRIERNTRGGQFVN